LSEREARCIKKFDDALAAMTYDACTQCRERDWDLGLRDGVCKRCRSDREDVRRWSAENNTNPIERPACCIGLTDIEEMMCSLVMPIMQVRYTKG
ncbi:hypothetical protein EXIGLDRAFT_578440, partial [Exidia glandulosa HHB12029]